MNIIMILYSTPQQNDAEHAKGVLEEELKTYLIDSQYIGKEVLQTKTTQFVFRDIEKPVKHNRYETIDKLYICKDILEDERVKQHRVAGKTEWIWLPTGGIIDYVMDVKDEIPKDKVTVYRVEDEKVKAKQVEIYKAKRIGYFETQQEAQNLVEHRKEVKENEVKEREKVKGYNEKVKKTKKKKEITI